MVYQAAAVAAVAALAWFLGANTLHNMRVRGIQSGFDFLTQQAGFSIGESLIPFDAAESYLKAFAAGLANTLRMALAGIVLATLVGTLVGVGRFSRNLLVRGLCAAYVECLRNIPVLLQLLVWYLVLTEYLPGIDDAWQAGPFFLSKGGLNFPVPVWTAAGSGAPLALDIPAKGEFAIVNGGALTPEFLALWLGLSMYTAAFIAEVVRGGIASVPRGQSEAAAALGLDRRRQIRRVLMPQALRVIVPPLTNQYLNITKNSSLAVAIGYPDVVSIANTAMNQTGRAVECIALLMAVYLTLSLATSALMNLYNARVAIREK
jgi:general L-amino acid transport system permease protein